MTQQQSLLDTLEKDSLIDDNENTLELVLSPVNTINIPVSCKTKGLVCEQFNDGNNHNDIQELTRNSTHICLIDTGSCDNTVYSHNTFVDLNNTRKSI